MPEADGATYEAAGVSLEKADSFLGALLSWVGKTEAIPGAALKPVIPNGYYASVLDVGLSQHLALCTDGVGSKILVAEMAGDFTGIGIDCIAMNVNDLICVGARPLCMVDYLAIQDPPVEIGDQIGRGLYEGARQAGISIPGGELAQLPEMIRGIREGEGIDLTGAALGLVPKDEVSNGQGLAPGDQLIGIASSGLHSNGYTLARNVIFERAGLKIDQHMSELSCTVGEELVRPTEIYVPQLRKLWAAGLTPKATMHITGGGFLNLLRAQTEGINFVVEPPPLTPVFQLIQRLGKVSDEEMHRVFNLGVGMVLVVAEQQVGATIEALEGMGPAVFRLGQIERGDGKRVSIPSRGLVGEGGSFRKG